MKASEGARDEGRVRRSTAARRLAVGVTLVASVFAYVTLVAPLLGLDVDRLSSSGARGGGIGVLLFPPLAPWVFLWPTLVPEDRKRFEWARRFWKLPGMTPERAEQLAIRVRRRGLEARVILDGSQAKVDVVTVACTYRVRDESRWDDLEQELFPA